MNQVDNTPQIELQAVSKSYNRNLALDKVSMHINRHEVIGLIGENGAGKSTLLKILGGMHQPDSGTMLIHGEPRVLRGLTAASADGIGVVHQEQSLIETLTVAENISLGGNAFDQENSQGKISRLGFFRWKQIEKEAREALTRIGSSISPKARVSALSFADRQMVEIAKAVRIATRTVAEPLIILDEPTSVLEKGDIERLEKEIQRLKAIGSVVFVSHRLDEIRRICDRVYVLRSGKVVGEWAASEIDDDQLFFAMTGRTMVERRPTKRSSANIGQHVLTLESVGRHKKFSRVSLTVERGQVHAIVGTAHSGREELCRAVFGIDPLHEGRIVLNGKPISRSSIRNSIRQGIGYLPSERKVEGMITGMTVAENISLTHPGASYWGPLLTSTSRDRETLQWIESLDIRPPVPGAGIDQLSGGNQQKAVFAKWAKDPNLKLLVLDHPTRGVDPGAREHINAAIDGLCDKGVGVLLLADTLDEALMLGHRITVMRDGQITASFANEGNEAPEMATLVENMV